MLNYQAHYFKKLPLIKYKLDDDGKTISLINVLSRSKVTVETFEEEALTYNYVIKDGETIEYIAGEYYGNPAYSWIIMMMNNFYDIFDSWPMDDYVFKEYIIKKYGTDESNVFNCYNASMKTNVKDIGKKLCEDKGYVWLKSTRAEYVADQLVHHYEDSFGNHIHEIEYINLLTLPSQFRPKKYTVYEWEYKTNNDKRNIILLNNDYLSKFVESFEQTMDMEYSPEYTINDYNLEMIYG